MNPGAGGSSLLVIGGAKTGKTHYAGQLLRRLEAKKHLLKMAIAASDRTPLQEVLEKLAVGRSASHTPNNIYRESVWDVWIDGSPDQSQLIWPDYGGEQIEDIVRKRQITEPWIQRVRDSAGLLFFVRPSLMSGRWTFKQPEALLPMTLSTPTGTRCRTITACFFSIAPSAVAGASSAAPTCSEHRPRHPET